MIETKPDTPMSVPLPDDDIEHVWPYLSWYLHRILLSGGTDVDLKTYMSLYTVVHNFCTASYPGHRGNRTVSKDAQMERFYRSFEELIKTHLVTVCARLDQHTEEALLDIYLAEWTRFNAASKYNDRLFMFVNRHWVKREQDEGRTDLHDIYNLHLTCWKEAISGSTRATIITATRRLVERQTLDGTAEQTKVNEVLESFKLLGMEEAEQM